MSNGVAKFKPIRLEDVTPAQYRAVTKRMHRLEKAKRKEEMKKLKKINKERKTKNA